MEADEKNLKDCRSLEGQGPGTHRTWKAKVLVQGLLRTPRLHRLHCYKVFV